MANSEEEISDTEQVSVPSPKVPRLGSGHQRSSTKKFTGAAAYKSAFQACWQKKWPVKNDQYSFQCTVSRLLVVGTRVKEMSPDTLLQFSISKILRQ